MAYIEHDDPWDEIYQSKEKYKQMELVWTNNAIHLFLKQTYDSIYHSDMPENKSLEKLAAFLYEALQLGLNSRSYEELEQKLASFYSDETINQLVEDIFSEKKQDKNIDYQSTSSSDINDTSGTSDTEEVDDWDVTDDEESITVESLVNNFLHEYNELNVQVRRTEHYLQFINQAPYKMHVNFPLKTQLTSSCLAAKEIKEILIIAATEETINCAKSFSGLLEGELKIPLEHLGSRFINHAQITIYLPSNPNFSKIFDLIKNINQIMDKHQIISTGAGIGDSLLAGGVSLRRDYDDEGNYKSADIANENDLQRNCQTPLYKEFKEHKKEGSIYKSKTTLFDKKAHIISAEKSDNIETINTNYKSSGPH